MPRESESLAVGAPSWLGDWVVLTKARIGSFVFAAAWVGGLLAGGAARGVWPALEAAAYVLLVGASSSIFNQVVERDTDRLMLRTQGRPLPTGRVRTRDAVWIGTALGALGTGGLAARFGLLVALLALGTLVAYALVYTPLKRHSTLNTVVGAVPGAMPPLLGYVAIAGEVGSWAIHLFLLVFVWQFPHFLAIAWLHREDYARAGMRMLPSLPNAAGLAGRHALLYGLVQVPVSLYPGLRGEAGPVYLLAALLLGLGYAGCALRFALCEDRSRARALLFASLIYLPLMLAMALADPVVRDVARGTRALGGAL